MKRNLFIAVAFFATMTASAQNIAAVSPSNETTIYQTLDEAVKKAADGSIIYLPGGGFQINDTTKISHKLTIMGVSHRGDTDNADGATVIAGNLNFVRGSDGSSVIGVFISGNINVGTSEEFVTNLTIRHCNVNRVVVYNSQSNGMVINQCYLRSSSTDIGSDFGNCNVCLENNVIGGLGNINGGIINHNIICSGFNNYSTLMPEIKNSSFTNNFILPGSPTRGVYMKSDDQKTCYISNNCTKESIGENCQSFSSTELKEIFKAYHGVSISSDFHLVGEWGKGQATDGTDIGIYGGSGFSEEKSFAPIPRIISKKVDEQTDGSGKLKIEVTIKAK